MQNSVSNTLNRPKCRQFMRVESLMITHSGSLKMGSFGGYIRVSNTNRFLLSLAFVAMLTASLGMASTVTLPGASYEGGGIFSGYSLSGTLPSKSFTSPGTYTVSASPSNFGTASESVSPGPLPTVSGSESITAGSQQNLNNYLQSASSSSSMQYDIEFSGPSGSVPILVNALMSATVAGNTNAYARFSVENLQTATDPIFDLLIMGVGNSGGASSSELRGVITTLAATLPSASLVDSGVWLAQTNTVYLVDISTDDVSFTNDGVDKNGNTIFVSASGSASVDPTFQIASSVTDPQDYSISISPGVGNTAVASTATPEPASSALVMVGVGIFGWLARRLTRA
jgi:hypothetical protein